MGERFALPIYEGVMNGISVGQDIVKMDGGCRLMMTIQIKEMLDRSLEATERLLSLSLTRLKLMNQEKLGAIQVSFYQTHSCVVIWFYHFRSM